MPVRYQRCTAYLTAWALPALGLALLGGCRSAPPPVEQLVVARIAIEDAVAAGAAEQAPKDLENARAKLAWARDLAAKRKTERAREVAEEAELDARVAAARARRARARGELARIEGGARTAPAVGAP